MILCVAMVVALGGAIQIAGDTSKNDDPTVLGTTDIRAGARGQVGCGSNCEATGFMNLDGASNLVIENMHISNPNGRCLSVNGARNVTIRNSTIGPCGTRTGVSDGYETGMITVIGSSNITFEGNLISDIASVKTVRLRNNAMWIVDSPDTTIVDNRFEDIHSDISQKRGNYGNRAIGAHTGNARFVVSHNTFVNAGRNAVQFQRNYNVPGVEISHNLIEGRGPWNSDYEDMVNLYASTGTANSPIVVRSNLFRNGGASTTGTGIIVGDGNPRDGTNRHVVIEDNAFINPGHVGIGVAGGSDIVVRNNTVFSAPHGSTPRSAVGMYVNHFDYGPNCSNIRVENNSVNFANTKLPNGVNHVWNPQTCSGATLRNNNFGDLSLTGDAQATPAASSAPASSTATPSTATPSTATPATAAPSTAAPSTAAPAPTNNTPATDAPVANEAPATPRTPATAPVETSKRPATTPAVTPNESPSTSGQPASTAPNPVETQPTPAETQTTQTGSTRPPTSSQQDALQGATTVPDRLAPDQSTTSSTASLATTLPTAAPETSRVDEADSSEIAAADNSRPEDASQDGEQLENYRPASDDRGASVEDSAGESESNLDVASPTLALGDANSDPSNVFAVLVISGLIALAGGLTLSARRSTGTAS